MKGVVCLRHLEFQMTLRQLAKRSRGIRNTWRKGRPGVLGIDVAFTCARMLTEVAGVGGSP